MRWVPGILLVVLSTSLALAQSLFVDKGHSGGLMLAGYSRSADADGLLAYFGISYANLSIKTDHGTWTESLSDSSMPVQFGVTTASGAWVGDVRVNHASGESVFTISVGRLL